VTTNTSSRKCWAWHVSPARSDSSPAQAHRLCSSVTTATQPSHEYVAVASELHVTQTHTTHHGLHAGDLEKITKKLDLAGALADLGRAARNLKQDLSAPDDGAPCFRTLDMES
jgi:hypothetical protein